MPSRHPIEPESRRADPEALGSSVAYNLFLLIPEIVEGCVRLHGDDGRSFGSTWPGGQCKVHTLPFESTSGQISTGRSCAPSGAASEGEFARVYFPPNVKFTPATYLKLFIPAE